MTAREVTYGPGTATIDGKQYTVDSLKLMIQEEAPRVAHGLQVAGFNTTVEAVAHTLVQLSGNIEITTGQVQRFFALFPKRQRKAAQWKAERRNYPGR